MKKVMFVAVLALLCCLSVSADDLAKVKKQLAEAVLMQSSELTRELTAYPKEGIVGDQVVVELYQGYPLSKEEGEKLLSTMNADGSWRDLGYVNIQGDKGVVNLHHVSRVLALCIAWRSPSSPFYQDVRTRDAISRSMDNWIARHYVLMERTKRGTLKKEFWYNDIGIPRVLGQAFILFEDQMNEHQHTAAIEVMKASRIYGQGQNKIWLSGNVLMRGLLEGNAALVSEARDSIVSEITYGEKAEGIQKDYSYLMHGPQQQFGNYGAIFIGDMSFWALALRNSQWAFPQDRLDIIARYATEGLSRVLWKGMLDVNGLGRQHFRYAQRHKGLYMRVAAYRLGLQMSEQQGIYHFQNADQTVCRQKEWMTSVRMSSTRTLGGEAAPTDNLKGYYMSDGATYTYVDGDEYENIQPLWDWHRLPGTTAYDTDTPLKLLNYAGYRSQSSYVGHVGNGRIGMTTMNLVRDKLDALKSWVFTDQFVLCLGAGITSPQDSNVVTSIDQLNRKSDLLHLTKKEWQPVTDYQTEQVSDERFFHGKTGYIVLSGNRLIAKDEERTGSWHDNMTLYPQDMTVTGHVVSLWFDHGNKPRNADYAYLILPATTQKTVANFRLKDIEILRNDRQIQAIHLPKEKAILTSVFQLSAIQLPNGISFQPDQTGLYLIDYSKNKTNPAITYVDPTK